MHNEGAGMIRMLAAVLTMFCLSAAQFATETERVEATTDTIRIENRRVFAFKSADFRASYMGFANVHEEMQLISFRILTTDVVNDTLTFSYAMTMNSDHSQGTGKIIFNDARIEIPRLPEGRVSLPDGGKIIFESVDNTNHYWKLKEM